MIQTLTYHFQPIWGLRVYFKIMLWMLDLFYLHLSKVKANTAVWERLCNAVVSYGTKEGLTAKRGKILAILGHVVLCKQYKTKWNFS